jgi:hypothetical protein
VVVAVVPEPLLPQVSPHTPGVRGRAVDHAARVRLFRPGGDADARRFGRGSYAVEAAVAPEHRHERVQQHVRGYVGVSVVHLERLRQALERDDQVVRITRVQALGNRTWQRGREGGAGRGAFITGPCFRGRLWLSRGRPNPIASPPSPSETLPGDPGNSVPWLRRPSRPGAESASTSKKKLTLGPQPRKRDRTSTHM